MSSFDFDAAVTAPFRMQPGLRRMAPGNTHLTPIAPGSRHQREKLAVLSALAPQALCAVPGFDAAAALAALCSHAAAEHPGRWSWDGRRGCAARLGAAVTADGDVEQLAAGAFGLGDEVARCLHCLPARWRLPGLLSLSFVEDFALVDATSGRVPWLAVCLPSHWAPEAKVGRHFTEIHAPVADNQLLLKATDSLLRLVTADQRWERFVWNVTDQPQLHAHPDHADGERWSHGSVDRAWLRTERQTFIPLRSAAGPQAWFTIAVDLLPMAEVIQVPGRAAALHAAISSMSPAVLAYRGLARVQTQLLAWLAEQQQQRHPQPPAADVKTQPVTPARVEFGDQAAPSLSGTLSAATDPQPIDALQRASHVLLQGNDLPRRWAGRAAFTILDTCFGLGHNFLAAWDAWRADAQRCTRLYFVAIEGRPPLAEDLQRAHVCSPLRSLAAQVLSAWPPLTPNLHVMEFEQGRVQLLLALGAVERWLPGMRAAPDAFFLDGLATSHGPMVWQPRVLKALGRMAATGATLASASTAHELRAGLLSAGFAVRAADGQRDRDDTPAGEITVARHAPRFARIAATTHPAPGADAIVIGAGIAGAAVAGALSRVGLQVTVIDRQATPAAETSGNPGGLFHGTVHPDDGRHARLFRAAALVAQRDYGAAAGGLLRLGSALPAMRALLQQQGLPIQYVQALDAAEAAALAGVALPGAAWWHYPGGGWLWARDWVQQQLGQPGVRWLASTAIQGLGRDGRSWAVHDAAGRTIASAPVVVLANAAGAAPLLAPLGHAAWPLTHSRGQVTWFATGDARQPLRLPVAGDGYAIPLDERVLLCGASRDEGEPPPGADEPPLREADHRHNIDRLQRLTGLAAPADPAQWSGRAGWRLQAADRLPIAGAMPLPQMPAGQRLDQVRLLPRESGLFVLTALGARGLTLAPLLGRLIAAQASGTPWPLEQDLADAVDPGRWLVRKARRTFSSDGPALRPAAQP